jgi:hypothetical protein
VADVITCCLGGRGTRGPLALPRKELGEQSGVEVADLASAVPQEGKLFLGSGLCLGQILGRAQDALSAPPRVPFPAFVRPLPKTAREPADFNRFASHFLLLIAGGGAGRTADVLRCQVKPHE